MILNTSVSVLSKPGDPNLKEDPEFTCRHWGKGRGGVELRKQGSWRSAEKREGRLCELKGDSTTQVNVAVSEQSGDRKVRGRGKNRKTGSLSFSVIKENEGVDVAIGKKGGLRETGNN